MKSEFTDDTNIFSHFNDRSGADITAALPLSGTCCAGLAIDQIEAIARQDIDLGFFSGKIIVQVGTEVSKVSNFREMLRVIWE